MKLFRPRGESIVNELLCFLSSDVETVTVELYYRYVTLCNGVSYITVNVLASYYIYSNRICLLFEY